MVGILEAGQHEIVHHDEDGRFTQTTPDREWIQALSRDPVRPIVVSGDCKMLKRPDEVSELRNSSMTYFCLADHWPDLPVHEMTWKFFKVWPEIVSQAAVTQPTVYMVKAGKSLKVERYRLTKDA